MITLLTDSRQSDAFAALCGRDIVSGGEMCTRLAVFGPGTREADFWLQTGPGGGASGAVCRHNGRVYLTAAPECDLGELAAFLEAAGGFGEVQGEAALCARLFPHSQIFSAPAMAYFGGFTGEDHSGIEENPPLDALYWLICEGFSSFDNWGRDRWYAYTSHLFRHGLGFAAGIRAGGRLVSTAGVYAVSSRHAVIACVATDPAHRSAGHAARLVRYLCDRILRQNRIPTLLCAGETLAGFYGGLGFTVQGRWGKIQIEGRNQEHS